MLNKKANPLLQKTEQASRDKVAPDQKAAYDKIVAAGVKLMYSEKLHKMLLEQLRQPGDPATVAGQGVAKLLGIMMNQAKGAFPMKAGIPAATALLCEALDMLDQLGKIKVTNDTVSAAMQSLGSSLLQLFGVTPQKLDSILSKQASPAQSAMQSKNTAQNAANPTPAPTRPGPQPLIGAPA